MFERLQAPGKIGRLTLKNRIFMPAMGVFMAAPGGGVNDEIIAFYEARARGGVGLIITEVTRVDGEAGAGEPCQLAAYRPSDVIGLQRIVDTVHKYDTKIFVQLQHPGREASAMITGVQAVAPSAVANPAGGEMPRALSTEECQEHVEKFIRAGIFVQMSGADGVELHGAHGYLINEFLSPAMNFRTDRYGGSFENRMRFVTEIIQGIRQACGASFPVSVRINAEEMLAGGIDLPEAQKIAVALEAAGADAINVSTYSLECIEPGTFPQGNKKRLSQAIKTVVQIPVLGVSNIKDPVAAEALLAEAAVDFVGVGRGHLADPDWVNKAFCGRADEIRKCIGCLACFGEIVKLHRIKCAVNPVTGREREYADPERNGGGRLVVIVGGGPAGIEAALTLKDRGFEAVIFDGAERLGGTLNTADKGDGKGRITAYTDSLISQVKRAGITLRLGEEATVEKVKALAPDWVFLACGAEPLIPAIPGLDKKQVVTAEEVLLGQAAPTGKVAVIGSGMTGLETAEVLAARGCQLTLVEMLAEVGPGMYPTVVADVMGRILESRPQIFTGHQLIKASATGLELRRMADDQIITVAADWIVLALGVRPRQAVIEKFRGSFEHCSIIGDARCCGRILEATQDAHGKASVVQPCWD